MNKFIKQIYMRFAIIWGDKFTHNHPTDDFVKMWWHDWQDGLSEIDPAIIKKALDYCKLNMDWPPSLAEFIRICEMQSGVPGLEDAFELAIRRNFTHPAIKEAFEKIGSWDFSHQDDKTLRRRFKEAYSNSLESLRVNQALEISKKNDRQLN